MSHKEFCIAINKLRLANKDRWYTFTGYVNNDNGLPVWVEIKGYNTWLQIFRVAGVDCSNPMDQTPTQFKKWLADNHFNNVKVTS